MNGLWQKNDNLWTLVVSEIEVSRNASSIIYWNRAKTFTFPRSTVKVDSDAFGDAKELRSVRLNAGLEILGDNSFAGSGIRKLVLPSSVREIRAGAF